MIGMRSKPRYQEPASFVYWWKCSNELHAAAQAVWGRSSSPAAATDDDAIPADAQASAAGLERTFRALAGKSLELLLKAYAVRNDREFGGDHDLMALAEIPSLQLGPRDRAITKILASAVASDTIYSVPDPEDEQGLLAQACLEAGTVGWQEYSRLRQKVIQHLLAEEPPSPAETSTCSRRSPRH